MNLEVRPLLSALKRNKAGTALIVLQIAITLAVLCNSLFIVLDRAARIGRPSGMDEVDTFTISSLGFGANFDLRNALREDLDALRHLPGVRAATPINTLPMSWNGWNNSVDAVPLDRDSVRRGKTSAIYVVDEQGVSALGATLVEGRDFLADDVVDMTGDSGITARGVIVTRPLAEAVFPGESAIGKALYGVAGSDTPVTVVGVIEHLQQPWPTSRSVDFSTLLPARQLSDGYSMYLVRTEPGQRDRVMPQVETKLGEINPARLLRQLQSIESVRESSYREDVAMMTILIGVMAGLVLVTGAGIVGAASFWVTRRVKQIGTRRALGARRVDILRHFQIENALIVAMGVLLGLLLTYAFNLWLMQHYQAPRLPWFYLPIGAAAVFALGQLAVLGPATRATRVPPAVATRSA